MASPSVSPFRSHSTSSVSEVSYDLDSHLKIEISTPGLSIRSIESSETEYSRYEALNSKSNFMSYFAIGDRWDKVTATAKINEWVNAWKEKAVYQGAFSIFEKSTRDFVGIIVLRPVGVSQRVEYFIFGNERFWKQPYFIQANRAIVDEFVPLTIEEGHLLNGKPVEIIETSAHSLDSDSDEILLRVGMTFDREQLTIHGLKRVYSISVKH